MPLRRLIARILDRTSAVEDLRNLRSEVQRLRSDVEEVRKLAAQSVTDFQLDSHPRYGDAKRLLRYAAQVCSQNGEDGMIREIFRRIGTADRFFVEIGIGDGTVNNTAFLLSQGWCGRWIDGNDAFKAMLAKRPDLSEQVIRGLATFVNRENIAPLLTKLDVPDEFDLLSIDVDQNTYHVWDGLHAYRPRVVVMEYNSAFPADVDWKANYDPDRMWDHSNNYGASLKALELLGRRLGYSLVGCDIVGANAFFVRDDLLGDHFVGPYTAENHYEPPRFGMSFQWAHPRAIPDRPPDA